MQVLIFACFVSRVKDYFANSPVHNPLRWNAPVFQICATWLKKRPVIGNRCVVLICGFTEIAAENQNRVRL